MSFPLADLPWLPRFQGDLRAELAELDRRPDLFVGLRRLASCHHAEAGLRRLSRAVRAGLAGGADTAGLVRCRLGILSTATTSLLGDALVAAALRHGVLLDVVEAPMNMVVQEACGRDGVLRAARPDVVLVALGDTLLPSGVPLGDAEAAGRATDESLAHLRAVVEGVRSFGATAVVENLVPPAEALFGNLDGAVPGTARQLANAINQRLAGELSGLAHILDVAALASQVGTAAWNDRALWLHAKIPFSPHFLPLYADHVARLLAALRGRSRKCLVLDLDNTLWGGVIGDDGLEGISLGQGSAMGEAFVAVQQAALRLRERGIVLAVCSKNTEAVARLPFHHHPDMVLREEHIAVFQANWSDKAANLRAIAASLSLGTDALVFLDDNPAERALVRAELPEIAVPELPADPAYYPHVLHAAGYFEAVAFVEEDRRRAAYYAANAARATVQSGTDLDAYLASLDMVATIAAFDPVGRARIAQLINKSNQYNLTTRRYTEEQVAAMERDPAVATFQVRLADRFGDNGMVCVVICRTGPVWEIDTWLMSCRVLGRRLEEAVLQAVVAAAHAAGADALRGCYLPSGRNGMVEDHYRRLGFTPEGEDGEGAAWWSLDVASFRPTDPPIRLAARESHREEGKCTA